MSQRRTPSSRRTTATVYAELAADGRIFVYQDATGSGAAKRGTGSRLVFDSIESAKRFFRIGEKVVSYKMVVLVDAVIPSGYRYGFEGTRNWQTSSDERWEIEVGDEEAGRLLGERRIDGARCLVVRTRTGRIVAATKQSVQAPSASARNG